MTSAAPIPTAKLIEPEWRAIPDWPYECTACGRIRRTDRREMKIRLGSRGYAVVTLTKNKTAAPLFVHRLVYQTWKGPILNGLVIDHIDGNKLNNHASNLEAVTHQENVRRAQALKLCPAGDRHWARRKKHLCVRGLTHGNSALDRAAVLDIRLSAEKTKVLADRYGVTLTVIQKVRSGKTYADVVIDEHK